MRASLTVVSGPLARQSIEVSHGKLLIGREPDCHLRPDSPLVSRHHCVLLLDDYTLRIRDLASKNGTFVNSRRVGTSETILSHGDIVALGDMVCQASVSSAATEAEPMPRGEKPKASPSSLEGTGVFGTRTFWAASCWSSCPSRDIARPRETCCRRSSWGTANQNSATQSSVLARNSSRASDPCRVQTAVPSVPL